MPEELSLNNPMVIIGHEDVVSGFQALGFKAYSVKDASGFKSALEEILNKRVAVCLVQEDIYNVAQDQINNLKHSPLPIFVPFGKSDKAPQLDNIIRDFRLRATGAF